MFEKAKCSACNNHPIHHVFSWFDYFVNRITPSFRIPRWADACFDLLIEKICAATTLVEMHDDFSLADIQPRSACFVAAAQKRGISFRAACGPAGYTGNFSARFDKAEVRFNTLPTADHLSRNHSSFTDSKERTKQYLKKAGFPVARGRAFSFYQKKQALKFGCETLGFPLVVKPQHGSVARHVTTDIQNREALKEAIRSAVKYSPSFIVERFIEGSAVHRATVVNFDFVAVVRQVPANVCGDGSSTIKELVTEKNWARRQEELNRSECSPVLQEIPIDDTAKRLLKEQGYNLDAVPKESEAVYLQVNPFLSLGADLVEVTEVVHPENKQLFRDVAKVFDMRLVGIDFIVPDISTSFSAQRSAILELNSVPCIEMHHFPSSGESQNVADRLVDLFFSAYL